MATVNGSAGKDFIHRSGDGRIVPAAYADVLGVTAGADVVLGLGGNDIIFADLGNDIIDGGAGADTMTGEGGDDWYYVDNAGDTVAESGGGGTDRVLASVSYVLTAAAQVELITTRNAAGVAAINLTGNSLGQQIVGNAGANAINGGGGADLMRGLSGNDAYHVDNIGDRITEAAGGGNDRILAAVSYALAAGVQVETVSTADATGTTAIDLTGNAFAQTIIGNAGTNTINGKAGADVMEGLGGNDRYYVDAGDVIKEVDSGGNDRVLASVSYSLNANAQVELLTTVDSAASTAINLKGSIFSQQILGNAGANLIDGGGGVDLMQGFGGNDLYYVDNTVDTIIEGAGGGNDRVLTSATYVLAAAAQVELITTRDAAGFAGIKLTGNSLGQQIIGNAGANTINGGGGADLMQGLGGDDTYYVENVGDRVTEAAGGGIDKILTTLSFALNAGLEVEFLESFAGSGVNLTGNEFAQTLKGDPGNNILNGRGGADLMDGGYGGTDWYYIDNPGDKIINRNGGADRVLCAVSYTLMFGDDIALTTLDSSQTTPINLTGNTDDQVLIGNQGSNTLNGGLGFDTLHGLGGKDAFAFDHAFGLSVIADFSVADDTIRLAASSFALAAGALDPDAFHIGAAAADASDRIIYDSATGKLFSDWDGNGLQQSAIQFATLTPGLALTSADFFGG
jgi:Ca2+-binding RTX toxin-like protein